MAVLCSGEIKQYILIHRLKKITNLQEASCSLMHFGFPSQSLCLVKQSSNASGKECERGSSAVQFA